MNPQTDIVDGPAPMAGNLVLYPSAWDAVTRRAAAVREARTLIRDLACIGFDVGCVSRAYRISRRALEREFTVTVGRSTRQEIALVRLNRAKFLLETTDRPIQNVGEVVGFWKSGSFVAFFRKQTGMSPSEYRGKGKIGAE